MDKTNNIIKNIVLTTVLLLCTLTIAFVCKGYIKDSITLTKCNLSGKVYKKGIKIGQSKCLIEDITSIDEL